MERELMAFVSRDPDPYKAGQDAIRQAKKSVPKPSLAIVFGSIHCDQKKLHAGVCSFLSHPAHGRDD